VGPFRARSAPLPASPVCCTTNHIYPMRHEDRPGQAPGRQDNLPGEWRIVLIASWAGAILGSQCRASVAGSTLPLMRALPAVRCSLNGPSDRLETRPTVQQARACTPTQQLLPRPRGDGFNLARRHSGWRRQLTA
jgi:hypothetical protein